MNFELRKIDSNAFNKWQATRHYLKRPIIRSKLLAHGVFVDNELVGGLLWATPHFTKKKGLFGFPDLLDKWEVLMLARFYLIDECEIIASQVMSESMGKGRNRGSHRRGWRLQEDWVQEHPPRFPENPYVPRMLISWSDKQWGHEGTIYKANGWELWDVSKSNGRRTNKTFSEKVDERVLGLCQKESTEISGDGEKRCWILRLGKNPRAWKMGQSTSIQMPLFAGVMS